MDKPNKFILELIEKSKWFFICLLTDLFMQKLYFYDPSEYMQNIKGVCRLRLLSRCLLGFTGQKMKITNPLQLYGRKTECHKYTIFIWRLSIAIYC